MGLVASIAADPLFLEAVILAAAGAAVLLAVRGLKRRSAGAARRKALPDLVSGVDLFARGEYGPARKALEAVIARDPENVEARILAGDACRELGDVAEAHRLHWEVATVFARDLPRNRRSLGHDLLLLGRAGEAIEHLERAFEADPEDGESLDLLLAAYLEAGRPVEAAAVSRRLGEGAGAGPDAERAKRRKAAVAWAAGRELVRRGEPKEGAPLLKTALKFSPGLVGPRLELVRGAWLSGGERAAERELSAQLKEMVRLAESGEVIFEPPAGATVPGGVAAAAPSRPPAPDAAAPAAVEAIPAPPAPPPAGDGRVGTLAPASPLPDLSLPLDPAAFAAALLPRAAVYACAACGRPAVEYEENCAGCGAFGAFLALDERPLAEVPGMREVFDEIVENRSFFKRLAERAAEGDGAAVRRLVSIGEPATAAVFREILRREDPAPLAAVLAGMGPGAAAAVLRGWRKARALAARRAGRGDSGPTRRLDGVIAAVLAGLGPASRPEIERLLVEDDPALRRTGLLALIRAGAADRVEAARGAVPARELVDCLNACAPEELGPFLDAVRPDGVLFRQILADRTFTACEALVAALARPANRAAMRDLLVRRGFSGPAYEALETRWADPAVRPVVREIVASYGRLAADHLLRTLSDSDAPAEVRADALALFLELGEEGLERLVERLAEGDADGGEDRAAMRGVGAFGDRAAPALLRAYFRSGILQKMGLHRRRLLRRKSVLLAALSRIGGPAAAAGLAEIAARESDPELKEQARAWLDRVAPEGGRT